MSELEDALEAEDPETRRASVTGLASETSERGRGLLVRALGDTDWRVRKEAARVAATVAEDWGLTPELVDGLCQGENVGLRNAALEVLERLGPRAASALLVALPRVPEAARKFVVAALGFAGGAGVEKLAELSNDADPNTAQAALEALARVGGARAEDALRGRLSSRDPVQRLAALEGLERLEARVELRDIAPLLEDRLTRRLALRVLGYAEEPEAVHALLAALDDSGAMAAEATVALGRVSIRGGPAARELASRAERLGESTRVTLRALLGAGSGGSDQLRRAAATVLLLAHDTEVLGVAAELASEERLSPVAVDALRRWGVGAIAPLLAVAPTLGPRAKAAALDVASDLAAAGAPSPALVASLLLALRETLADAEPVASASAAAALARWAEPSDAALLVAAARRFPELVARPAGRALERLARRSPSAVADAVLGVELAGAIGAALLAAVAALGGDVASDRLQATLNADDPRARRAAVMALAHLDGDRAAELAGFALADEDVDVQVAAVGVLARLTDPAGAPLGAAALRLGLRAGAEPVVARLTDPAGAPLGAAARRLALRAGGAPVVAAAARALGAIGDRGSVAALRELVSEGRPGVGVAAMQSLRALEDPGLDDLLVEALGQIDEELVKEALRAIAQSDAPRREARIALALEHGAWDVRQLAATLLADADGKEAWKALSKRLEREDDAGVRAAIERALAKAPASALVGDGEEER